MSDRYGQISIEPGFKPPVRPEEKKKKRRPQKPSNRKKREGLSLWWLIAAILMLLSGLYCLIGFVGVPYYFMKHLPAKLAEQGLLLNTGKYTFNPFTFTLQGEETTLATQDQKPLLSFQELKTKLVPLHLLRRGLVCDSISLNSFNLNLIRRQNNSYNLTEVFGTSLHGQDSQIMDFSELPFFFSLNNITIRNSTIFFTDIPAGKEHRLTDIQLQLPTISNIYYRAERTLSPHFSAMMNGSPIELSGTSHRGNTELSNDATELLYDITDFDLSIYSEYLPFSLPFTIEKGLANGRIELLFDAKAEKGERLAVSFEVSMSEVQLQNADQTVLVKAPAGKLRGKFIPVAHRLLISELSFDDYLVTSYGQSFLHNLENFIKENKSDTSSPSPLPPQAKTFQIHLSSLRLDGGKIQLFPDKTSPKTSDYWENIQLRIGEKGQYTAEKPRYIFRLNGEKKGGSPYFSWQGEAQSLARLTGQLTLIKIPAANILSQLLPGNTIKTKGLADLKAELQIDGFDKDQTKPGYQLKNGDLSLRDLFLDFDGQLFIRAPRVRIGPLNTDNSGVTFGNLLIENGYAHCDLSRAAGDKSPFSGFTDGSHTFQNVEFKGNIDFTTPGAREKITFQNVLLQTDNPTSREQKKKNFNFDATVQSQGRIKATGSVNTIARKAIVETVFKELPANAVFSLFSSEKRPYQLNGNITGKGSLRLPELSFSGDLQFEDGSLKDQQGTSIRWNSSNLTGLSFSRNPFHLQIESAEFLQPQTTWDINKQAGDPLDSVVSFSRNLFAWQNGSGQKPDKKTIPEFTLKELSFSKASIQIKDSRLSPPWQSEITDLSGQMKNIHSPSTGHTGDFQINGLLAQSKLDIEGSMDLFSIQKNGQYKLSVEKLPMNLFTAQLLESGLDINSTQGSVDVKNHVTIKNGTQESKTQLQFINLEANGVASSTAFPLALLADSDGVFSFKSEDSFAENDRKTSLYEKAIRQFQTSLVKASVSPLLLPSEDFTDLISIECIEFVPGEFLLSDEGRNALKRYAALLINHPKIGLVLSGITDSETDQKALLVTLTEKERKRAAEENQRRLIEFRAKRQAYEDQLRNRPAQGQESQGIIEVEMPPELRRGFTPEEEHSVELDETALYELANKRLGVLYDRFTSQLALQANRIFIAPPLSAKESAGEITNGVHVQLRAIAP